MAGGANGTIVPSLVLLWVDAPSVVKVEAAEADKALLRVALDKVDVSVVGAGFNCVGFSCVGFSCVGFSCVGFSCVWFNCVGFNVPRPWRSVCWGATLTSSSCPTS